MFGIIIATVITVAIVRGIVNQVRETNRKSREFKAETQRMMGR
jgi:hypothetical protein